MKISSQIHVGASGIRQYNVQLTGEKCNSRDLVVLLDKKGNVVSIEAEVLWKGLVAISAAADLTPEKFFATMRTILEEEKKEEK